MAWAEKRGRKWKGVYRDPEGHKRSVGVFDAKKAALQEAQREEHKIQSGDWTDPNGSKMLFSEYFEQHWLPHRMLEKNTLRTYRSHYNAALKIAFGELTLGAITTPLIQRWITTQVRAGVKPSTIEARYKVLAICLGATRGASAVRDRLMAKTPCVGIELPVHVRPEKVVYSPEEVEALMRHLDEWWQPLIMLAADTGMRIGELLGLRAGDLVDGVIAVNRTLIELTKADTDNGTPFEEKAWPKGKKRRRVRVSPEIDLMLQALIRERKLFPADRLFSKQGRDGLPVRTEQWASGLPPTRSHVQGMWNAAHELTGIPRVMGESKRTFHALRGSHISWLLAGGADVTSVMNRAGHTQLSTTQLYVDAMSDADTRALEALSSYRARRLGPKGLDPARRLEG